MSDSTPPDSGAFDSSDPLWSQLEERLQRLQQRSQSQDDSAKLREKLAARAQALRARSDSRTAAEERLMVIAFEKGGQRYGVPLADVVEVQSLQHYSPVPFAPPFIPGVAAWRGGMVALLDVGQFLGEKETGLADVHLYLLIETAGRRLAIVANEIEDIVSIPKSQLQPAPRVPGEGDVDWLWGVYDHNLLVLKLDRIVLNARMTNWRTKKSL